jgi:hypothetical protein
MERGEKGGERKIELNYALGERAVRKNTHEGRG